MNTVLLVFSLALDFLNDLFTDPQKWFGQEKWNRLEKYVQSSSFEMLTHFKKQSKANSRAILIIFGLILIIYILLTKIKDHKPLSLSTDYNQNSINYRQANIFVKLMRDVKARFSSTRRVILFCILLVCVYTITTWSSFCVSVSEHIARAVEGEGQLRILLGRMSKFVSTVNYALKFAVILRV